MALTGQAKTDYQREYMRQRRAALGQAQTVRPTVRPTVTVRPTTTQNYNPMMAGYVPEGR